MMDSDKNDIDVIMLSYAKTDAIIKMNNDCINSINNSSDKYKFNIFIIETESDKVFKYEQNNVEVIQPKVKFGYNKFLNIGLDYCKNDWVLITNNDTIYGKDFIDYMMIAHEQHPEILSMSPIDDTYPPQYRFNRKIPVYYGYTLKHEVAGWSILLHKKVIEKIGKFDEFYRFWYQDDDYIENMKIHNIKHALITDAKVVHLMGKSNSILGEWNKMVSESREYFNKKWNLNYP